MSFYETPAEYTRQSVERIKEKHKEHYGWAPDYRPLNDKAALLCLRVADLLTGPTGGGNAKYLAVCLAGADGSKAPRLAATLKSAALEFTRRTRS